MMPSASDLARTPLLQAGLDQVDQGISVFDPSGRLVIWNARFLELMDLPQSLVQPGVGFEDIVRYLARRGEFGDKVDIEALVAARLRTARNCPRFYTERTTFDRRTIAAQTTPLSAGGFVTVYTDVSERALAEALTPERSEELEARVNRRTLELRLLTEELRRHIREIQQTSGALAESEARLRLITDAVPAAIAYLDARTIVSYANRRYADLFQRQGQAVLGRRLAEIVSAPTFAAIEPHVARALGGATEAFELVLPRDNGQAVVIRNVLVPEIVDGAVRGMFVLALDVTEDKRAEETLRQAQKMSAVGQLAGGLAHDFNNLLTIIVGNLAGLRQRIGPELFGEYVEPAIRAGERGVAITRRLLAFARQQPLAPAPVDAPSLIAGTAQLLSRSLPGNITIHVTAEDDGFPALADPHLLENAIVNMAINARDAMPDGGVLTLATSFVSIRPGSEFGDAVAPGDYVRIAIGDTGTGMSAETLARAFEPFFTTKPFGSGSGLGLSMVYGFVKQSGGHITIRSQPGLGTTVVVLLPRAAVAPVEVERHSAAEAVRGPDELVLLVDDDDDVRHLIRRHLVDLGYGVIEARDGIEATDLFEAIAEIGVLVTDLVMPGEIDGIALARRVRQSGRDIRVVLVSGFAAATDGAQLDTATCRVLRKPFTREALAEALRADRRH